MVRLAVIVVAAIVAAGAVVVLVATSRDRDPPVNTRFGFNNNAVAFGQTSADQAAE